MPASVNDICERRAANGNFIGVSLFQSKKGTAKKAHKARMHRKKARIKIQLKFMMGLCARVAFYESVIFIKHIILPYITRKIWNFLTCQSTETYNSFA